MFIVFTTVEGAKVSLNTSHIVAIEQESDNSLWIATLQNIKLNVAGNMQEFQWALASDPRSQKSAEVPHQCVPEGRGDICTTCGQKVFRL